MPQEPNIYEIRADVKNMSRTLDEMKHEAEERGKIQIQILQKIAEQKTLYDSIIEKFDSFEKRLADAESDVEAAKSFIWKCAGALAVLTPVAGYALNKIF